VVKATNYCTGQLGPAATGANVDECVAAYLDGGSQAADNVISGIRDTLPELGGGGSGGGGGGGTGGGGVIDNPLGLNSWLQRRRSSRAASAAQ
jgi:hypothetical protein